MLDKVKEAKNETEELLESQAALIEEVKEKIEELDGLQYNEESPREHEILVKDYGTTLQVSRRIEDIGRETLLKVSKVDGQDLEVKIEWRLKSVHTGGEVESVLSSHGFRKGHGRGLSHEESYSCGPPVHFRDLDEVEEVIADLVGTYIATE